MSYGGYEYTERGFGGGFDLMGGFGGGFGGAMGGGGGFLNEEKTGGRGSEQKSRDKQSLIPLTVKQLVNTRPVDDVYRIDDVDLQMLKLVGIMTMPQEHSTNFTFRLNDCTGTLECKQWIEREAAAYGKIKSLREGSMVKVIGNLRDYEGKVHVLVYDVSPITDWNELTFHMLDVILSHCQRTKGPIPGTTPLVPAGGMSMASPAGQGRFGASTAAPGMGMSLHNAIKNESQGLNESIFQAYLSRPGNPAGLSYSEAMQVLRARSVNITLAQLVDGVRQLCDDGRLYTTIDDEHFCPTSNEF